MAPTSQSSVSNEVICVKCLEQCSVNISSVSRSVNLNNNNKARLQNFSSKITYLLEWLARHFSGHFNSLKAFTAQKKNRFTKHGKKCKLGILLPLCSQSYKAKYFIIPFLKTLAFLFLPVWNTFDQNTFDPSDKVT